MGAGVVASSSRKLRELPLLASPLDGNPRTSAVACASGVLPRCAAV